MPTPWPATDLLSGGPGGSGVDLLFRNGASIRTIVDASYSPNTTSTQFKSPAKYFDILSFDPRGVNNTTPHLHCFPDAFAQDTWKYQKEADGEIGTADTAVATAWARAKALGDRCSSDEDSESLIYHINTAAVVGDMVEIIERHAEWRELEARKWLSSQKCTDDVAEDSSCEVVLARTKWQKGEEKLLYWGFSYGTILGGTFAAMQPHRVGRLVIDGVVVASDYYSANWLKNLQDADLIMSKFYTYCHLAGPSRCAFHSGTSAKDIEKRLNALLEELKESPKAAVTSAGNPEIITFSDVLRLTKIYFYKPLQQSERMAALFADLADGNGTFAADMKQENRRIPCPTAQCSRKRGQWAEDCFERDESEVTHAIACSDAADVGNVTKEAFVRHIALLEGQSRWLYGRWSEIRLACVHWKARAKWLAPGTILSRRL